MSDLKMEDVSQEDVLHEKPCAVQFDSDAAAQTDSHPRLENSPTTDESSKPASALAVAANYSEAMAILRNLPKGSHIVWASVERKLKKIPKADRSNFALFRRLITGCVIEELDWKKFESIKRACKDEPRVINSETFSVLLFRMMGSYCPKNKLVFHNEETLYCEALALDVEAAESISLFLGLLKLVQELDSSDRTSHLYPLLKSRFRDMETLLMKKRAAPKIRQFLKPLGKTAGSGSEDDCDDNSEEDGSPSRKRRCIKAEE